LTAKSIPTPKKQVEASQMPFPWMSLLQSTFLPMRISLPAITSHHMPELTHSAFRPSGVGETCDKADGSLRRPCNLEVIALCKKSTMRGKKAVVGAANEKNTGAAFVTALWNGRT